MSTSDVRVRVGDWLVLPEGPGHPRPRRGLVVALLHPDGTPPYRVRWLDEVHESVLFPPPDAHVRRGPAVAAGDGSRAV